MTLPAIVRKAAALCLLLASNAASTTILTLPAPGADERQLYKHLDAGAPALLSACGSAPDCQLLSSLPLASSTGEGMAPPPVNGRNYFTSSFAAGGIDMFRSRTGQQFMTYPDEPIFPNDAIDDDGSDEELEWKVKLRLLQAYTNMRTLVATDDISQGNARDAGKAGANAGNAAGSAVPDLGSLCVGRDGSFNITGASARSDCPTGSIYVSTKRGASMAEAEYAAYAQSVSFPGRGIASSHALQTADLRYTRNDPTLRQYRRCDDCDVDPASLSEPGPLQKLVRWMKHPVSLAVLALGLIATIVADAVGKSRRA